MEPISGTAAILRSHAAKYGFEFLAKAYEKFQSDRKIKSLELLLTKLFERLNHLESRIDKEGYKPDEFFEMFNLTAEAAAKTSRDEKIEILARLLTNVFLKPGPDKLDYTELEHFARCIDALSIEAIHVHGVICRLVRAKYRAAGHHDSSTLNGHISSHELSIAPEFEKKDADLVLGLVSQLAVWNLVQTSLPPIRKINERGWLEGELIFLTSLGGRLLDFIASERNRE